MFGFACGKGANNLRKKDVSQSYTWLWVTLAMNLYPFLEKDAWFRWRCAIF